MGCVNVKTVPIVVPLPTPMVGHTTERGLAVREFDPDGLIFAPVRMDEKSSNEYERMACMIYLNRYSLSSALTPTTHRSHRIPTFHDIIGQYSSFT